MMMNSLFYELLQMALGKRKTLSCTPCPEEWNSIFLMAQEQAVTGVAFLALDLIRNEQKPQQTLLYEWIGVSEQIKQRNLVVNNYCLELTRHFENAGFRCCILKGQGNAQMYFEPLSRIPGDIDIWLDADKEKIVSFIRKRFPDTNDSGMHLNYPILKDVEVEVHYRPQYLSCKKYDKRLQRYFSSISDVQFEHKVRLEGADGDICTPDLEFNLVLQFAHLLGHFYGDGIGLRHFVDLYYLLLQIEQTDCGKNVSELLRWLGMGRFSRGVMWIEKEILRLEDKYLIAEPSEKLGRIILKEIEKGGNFGRYDFRNKWRKKGILTRAVIDSYRLIRLSRVQPSEAFVRLYDKLTNVESLKEVINNSCFFS